MFEVNRSVVFLKPTQTFYNFYTSLPDFSTMTYDEVCEDINSYMIPKSEMKDSPSIAISDDLAHTIFEWELMLREVDHQYWPSNRTTVDDLLDFFEIQVIPLIVDTSEDDLNRRRM